MEFYNFLKLIQLNAIRCGGNICHFGLKSIYRILKFTIRLFSDVIIKLVDKYNRTSEIILILGYRNSGKTSLLYRIKLSEFIQTGPTGSLIRESFDVCRFCLTAADSCGHESLRDCDKFRVTLCELGSNDPIDAYQSYMRVSNKIIFVVDSISAKDSGALQDVSDLIAEHSYYQKSPKYAIFLAKSDLPGGLRHVHISGFLDIPKHVSNRYKVIEGSSLCGDGIPQLMEFMLTDRHEKQQIADLIMLD